LKYAPVIRTNKEAVVDLDNAIQSHAAWKFKFRNAIHGNEHMDVAAISKDNNCEFGKWLHGEAKALYGNDRSYVKCVAEHTAFHVEAGKIATAINAKKMEIAEQLMATEAPFADASKKVAVSIIELKNLKSRTDK
jgi:methyl-accepting chemotaxis protein